MIARKSPKRKKEDVIYKRICDEIDKEAQDNDEWICFFCQLPLGERAEHHHAKGRSGDLFTDKRYIVLGHHDCHTIKWHGEPHSKLVNLWWWADFKKRLEKLLEQ